MIEKPPSVCSIGGFLRKEFKTNVLFLTYFTGAEAIFFTASLAEDMCGKSEAPPIEKNNVFKNSFFVIA